MVTQSYSIPCDKNFCGGNFQDWLEVMITEKCNGHCPWCVEKEGFHPKRHIGLHELAKLICEQPKNNIILLGGEPTLYSELKLIKILWGHNKNVYLTTNGSRLSSRFANDFLLNLTGINISIHHYYLGLNQEITGITLQKENLKASINKLHEKNIVVRLNCNLIKNYIDSEQQIFEYIKFAKIIGADSIRFAELKNDEEDFVDLTNIFGNKYGINNDPFGLGCNTDTKLYGMPVNFRQMCGIQTIKRPKPVNPKQFPKQVLYYDGIFYNGWQLKKEKKSMTQSELAQLLKDVAEGKISQEEAQRKIEQSQADKDRSSGGCCY